MLWRERLGLFSLFYKRKDFLKKVLHRIYYSGILLSVAANNSNELKSFY
jgi:hypothetical protein